MSAPPPSLTRTNSPSETGGMTTVALTSTHTRVESAPQPRLVRAVTTLVEGARRGGDAIATGARWLSGTVTPAGWLVLVLATGGVLAGWVFGWVEALVAGLAALMLAIASVPFLFGARGYDVSMRMAHERAVAGDVVDGEIRIRNVGSRTTLPGRIDLPLGYAGQDDAGGLLELGVPLLRAGHEIGVPVTIPALRRGVITVGPPTAVRSDPVGLLRREHEWEERHELYVHPRTVAVPATSAGLVRDLEGNPSRRLVDADMSFHAIREYAPGDSRRQIHWKSTAKTGRLMVRQFEETLRSRLGVVLSLADGDYATPDEFELAVSAAASLGVQAVRDGRDLDVVTGADIPRVVRGRMRSIDVLTASAPRALLDGFSRLDRRDQTLPLEEVCRLTVEASDALSLVFVVCGSAVSLTRLRKTALAFSSETAVVAVVCDERAHPRRRPVGDLTVLTIGLLGDLSALMLRGAQS